MGIGFANGLICGDESSERYTVTFIGGLLKIHYTFVRSQSISRAQSEKTMKSLRST
jgi:hypothetical protein